MNENKEQKIVRFLFEMGTMRKLPRMHRQTFLTDDMSDNIATHSYRVTLIGWFLAKLEGADPYKVTMMCLMHDMGEVRSGDHNWIHKRYVKTFEDEIKEEQLGSMPFPEMKELADEYDKRESLEAIVAKDADMLDQIFLLREYVWQGNKEAALWLENRTRDALQKDGIKKYFQTKSAEEIYKITMTEDPSSWWNNLATSKNR